MSCSNPISILHPVRKNEVISVPCYHCSNCIATRVNQVAFLAQRQFLYYWLQKNQTSSFVTLTYNDDFLPVNEFHTSTLRRKDLQDFMKRFRINLIRYNKKHLLKKIPTDFKVIYSGEYGSDFGRPHYHLIFLGLNESQVKTIIEKSWFRKCRIDIGPLTNGGIRYVCKYIDKSDTPDKCVKSLRDSMSVESPFFYHSIHLALPWIIANKDRIIKNKFQFVLNGKKVFYPKYIIRFLSNISCIDYKPIILNELISRYGPKFKLPDKKSTLVAISQEQHENLLIKDYLKYNKVVRRGDPISYALSHSCYKPVSKFLQTDYINNLINSIGG